MSCERHGPPRRDNQRGDAGLLPTGASLAAGGRSDRYVTEVPATSPAITARQQPATTRGQK